MSILHLSCCYGYRALMLEACRDLERELPTKEIGVAQ